MKHDRPHPMGKHRADEGTSAGPSALGIGPAAEPGGDESSPGATPVPASTDVNLEFAHRTALALREEFPSELLQIVHFRGEWTAVMKRERIVDIMKFLRDAWNYKMCQDVTSVDMYPEEPRFLVVYHLLNLDQATRFRVKCPLPGHEPHIDSVVPVWVGAEYAEREVFDLMGIRFHGHPDLRRILTPDDYEHHPLRKDFPVAGFPMGIDKLKD